jgi:DNA polymerase bacteriophage-type
MTLHIDIETFSEVDLTSAGVYRYAEHESTSLNCVGYRIDNGPVHLWIPFELTPALEGIIKMVQERCPGVILQTGTEPPLALMEAWEGDPNFQQGSSGKRAHNAQFERVVLNGVAGQKLGLPKTEVSEWTCTAVKAAANGLQRALDDGAKALGTRRKDEGGRPSMLQLSKPRKPTKADPSTRWTFENAPEKWVATLCYNVDDVLAEYELDEALPDISEREQALYHLDQKINERGWKVDLDAVNNILFVVEQYKTALAAEFAQICTVTRFDEKLGDFVTEGLSPTQREKVAEWVRANGFPGLVDMTADYLRKVIKRTDVPPNVKRVLSIYSTYGAKSVSKLQAMLDAVCSDGRLRGMFLFYGAATGRWSSLIVQLQNMMRPVIKDPNVAIEAFAERDINLIRFLWPDTDPMKVAGSCIRGCLVSTSPSHDLIYPDYSGVEDRVNLWFFDDEQMLDVYRAYDAGKGRHPYSVTVCHWFGLDLATFSDEDPRRQQGKVGRLSLGYEGGVNAFVTMAETYGVDLAEMARTVLPLLPGDALDHAEWMRENHPYTLTDEITRDIETACNGLKFLYRQQHPKVRQGWKDLKEAAERAVEFPGVVHWLPNRKISFCTQDYKGRRWLCMRLPSGRKIKYYSPTWTPPRVEDRWLNGERVERVIPGFMEYWGVDTYTRQWMKLQTYGGKLDENADQGFSRDLLCNGMLALDAAGYSIVGSEHDKTILDINVKFGTVEEIKAHMITQPDYCAGLPLATDGKRVKRYGK